MNMKKAEEKFASNFQEAEQELLVLTSESVGGAGLYEQGIWEPHAGLLAWIDLADDSLHRAAGGAGTWLAWLAEDSRRGDWRYDLKALRIYRVRCRKSLSSGAWLLLEVLERDLQEPRLGEILTAYMQPVELVDELCGSFQLERRFDWFVGCVDWLGEECSVSLECDKECDKECENGSETATQSLAAFKQIYGSLAAWDEAFRAFAAAELTELANDWQAEDEDDAEPITEADFMRRMTISEFTIDPDGDYSAYYDDDDMFFGHVIMVEGNVAEGPGVIDSAYIAG